ncbi:MAG TPA: RHS repeat-associated core domain-containing protein [Anaerohalosphaeraceae bacterium]|nr:RHS repeat-associated core domain-containing protein [Anaerohalosphaeraceae bacterium]
MSFQRVRAQPARQILGNYYAFTGRELDRVGTSQTGILEIMYYRARYYDQDTGRFLQPDPLGYIDGTCLYSYVRNNPARFTDFMGLTCIDECSPRQVEYEILDNIVTPYHVRPGWHDIYRASTSAITGLNQTDWAQLVVMILTGTMSAEEIAGWLIELGYSLPVNESVERIINEINWILKYLEDAGYDAYLKIRIRQCGQKRCGFLWCKRSWKWREPYITYYLCGDNTVGGFYPNLADAVNSFDDCIQMFQHEMEGVNHGQQTLEDVLYKN